MSASLMSPGNVPSQEMAPDADAPLSRPRNSLLLHVCCGPCSIMPVRRLLDEGFAVTAWFMNPNIQPLSEYFRRREAAGQCAERLGIDIIYEDAPWDLTAWLRAVAGRDTPPQRCTWCCVSRMEATCAAARRMGFAYFSSSLLYSRYQPHEVIARAGHLLGDGRARVLPEIDSVETATMPPADQGEACPAPPAATHGAAPAAAGPRFVYRDFRTDWQAGIDASLAWGVYRQPYCGCVYSEAERYHKKLRRLITSGGGQGQAPKK